MDRRTFMAMAGASAALPVAVAEAGNVLKPPEEMLAFEEELRSAPEPSLVDRINECPGWAAFAGRWSPSCETPQRLVYVEGHGNWRMRENDPDWVDYSFTSERLHIYRTVVDPEGSAFAYIWPAEKGNPPRLNLCVMGCGLPVIKHKIPLSGRA